jgi:dipeptidyl aminopeptidase/acylaminoacyl peptidase
VGTRTIKFWAGALTALWLAGAVAACDRPGARTSVPETSVPLQIARADLFGEPARHGAQLAPRGDRIAFLAPRDGVTNLWVVSIGAMDDAHPVTDDRALGVRSFAWAHDNATLIYALEEGPNGAARLYAIDAAGASAPRALTPAGANAEIVGLSAADPGGVVIMLNQRDPNWPDLVRVDLANGRRTIIQRNSNTAAVRGFSRFVLDRDNRLRLGVKTLADGSAEVFARDASNRWYSLLTIPFEDAPSSQPLAFEANERSFLMLDSTGRDRAALVRVDSYTAAKTVLGESARADVVDVWIDPATRAPEAYAAEYLRREWRAIDPDAQADLDFLDRQLTGDFAVTSRSADDARWIVVEEGPTTTARSYLYERGDAANRRLTQLFRHRPALDQAALQPMTPVEIEARDGLTLVSYLTLPIGSDANADARPEARVPLVLAPHGGPWSRDSYGFNPLHQWLANRGYAVLSVNFRGSTGLGKAFLNAGNGQWGARMQDDLLDAAQWAVENGIAQPDRIAIVGSGFGGYAALAGLAFTPEQFRCAAAYGAPANLTAMVDGAPGRLREEMLLRVGDIRTAEGRSALRERSPLIRTSQMRRPLLLAMGGRDAFASRAEFDQIAQSLRARRIQLSSIVFPEEGRELVRPQNRLAYYAVLEHFLGNCLGGRIEPVGAAFEGAAMSVYDGATIAPGLSGFVRRAAAAPVQPVAQELASEPAVSEEEPPPLAPPPTEIAAPLPVE